MAVFFFFFFVVVVVFFNIEALLSLKNALLPQIFFLVHQLVKIEGPSLNYYALDGNKSCYFACHLACSHAFFGRVSLVTKL